ncbi:MAG: hypothetical protein RLZZ428_13, partial [Pseudomonadota bacterium]
TDTQDVTVTITGSNDTPVISAVDVTAAITEGATLSDSGSIIFADLDLTDRPTATQTMTSIGGIRADNTTPLELTLVQKTSIREAFSIIANETNGHNGTINWTYTISEGSLNFLAKDEVVTAVFTITVNDAQGGTDTQDVTVTIIGENDTPTVIGMNIDDQVAFGDVYRKEIAYLFHDLDGTDILRYSAVNLPMGLRMDANSGIISGNPTTSGIFAVTLQAMDLRGAYVERTYTLLVVAPAQPSATQAVDKPASQDSLVLPTVQVMLTKQSQLSDTTDVNTNTLTTQSTTSGSTGNSNVVEVNVGVVSVENSGKVSFGSATQNAFSVIGMTIEKVDVTNNQVSIKILDTKSRQTYNVRQADGSALPSTLTFDQTTGTIYGELPSGVNVLSLSVEATDSSGQVRVLNFTIDVNSIKNQSTQEPLARFEPLSEKIKIENTKLKGYGEKIASLLTSNDVA